MLIRLLILFTLCFHFLTEGCFAEDCKPDINLTHSGKCLAGLPTMDQGDSSHCWAFVSASLVDAQLRCPNKSDPGFRVSPWPIAQQENEHRVIKKIKSEETSTEGCNYNPFCHRDDRTHVMIFADSDENINNGATLRTGNKIITDQMNGRVCDHDKLGLTDSTQSETFFNMLRKVISSKRSKYILI